MASVYKNEGMPNRGITVSYPVKEEIREISHGDYYAVRQLAKNGFKVAAIKFVRIQYSLSLYEAKKIVDTIMECTEVLVG